MFSSATHHQLMLHRTMRDLPVQRSPDNTSTNPRFPGLDCRMTRWTSLIFGVWVAPRPNRSSCLTTLPGGATTPTFLLEGRYTDPRRTATSLTRSTPWTSVAGEAVPNVWFIQTWCHTVLYSIPNGKEIDKKQSIWLHTNWLMKCSQRHNCPTIKGRD